MLVNEEFCPFCGGEPHLKSKTIPTLQGHFRSKYYIICEVCKCKTAEFDSPRPAWAAWNRRLPASKLILEGINHEKG